MSIPPDLLRPRRPARWRSVVKSWLVVALPVGTAGYLNWIVFGYVATKLRSGFTALAMIGYMVLLGFEVSQAERRHRVFLALLLINWTAGTLHALTIRGRLQRALEGRDGERPRWQRVVAARLLLARSGRPGPGFRMRAYAPPANLKGKQQPRRKRKV